MLPVVILCGGFGTRLRPVVEDRPKVLAPVDGTPFLSYVLHALQRQSYTEIVLSTGYLSEMIEAYAGMGRRWGVHLRYVEEPEPLGTGGALRYVADEVGLRTPFLAMNGDTFFSGALDDLVAFHRARPGAQASMALVRVEQPDRYGTVQLEEETGAVIAFVEKQAAAARPAWINAGVYVLEPRLVEAIPPGRNVSLERDVFPRWVDDALYGCPFPDAAFLDIGTPDDYARAPDVLHSL